MDGGSSGKRAAEARREGESSVKRLNVTMEVDTLDCLICYEPLSPPIFQCSVGHFICSSCRHKQLDKKCPSCSVKTCFKRCFGVEHIVQAVKVPCSNANYGCVEKVTYYQKEEHEKVCPNAPCFCPESVCGFAGSTTTLLDHLTMHHKYRPITLTYSKSLPLCVRPGLHVLQCSEASPFFLLNMVSEPFGHAISLICVEPTVMAPSFKCDMEYYSFRSSYCESSSCYMRSSPLSDGLPTGYDFILPKGKVPDENGIILRIAIHDTEVLRQKTSGRNN
ncbi:hypothetical protein ACQ4PT_009610 [Festuca glaucescens]